MAEAKLRIYLGIHQHPGRICSFNVLFATISLCYAVTHIGGKRQMTMPDGLIIIPGRQVVQRGGEILPVRGRAFALLVILAERPGEIFGVRDLMSRLWPDKQVDEANLRNNINILRKALGDIILNVPARGYMLAGLARLAEDVEPPPPGLMPRLASAGRIFGRDQDLLNLRRQLDEASLVTITGAGGIGKTTLARSLVRALGPGCVTEIDLAPLSNSDGVLATMAACLGLTMPCSAEQIVASLQSRGGMVLFDNCEHVIHAMAPLVKLLFQRVPALRVMATSREPLGIVDETIFRLEPLAVPQAENDLASEDLQAFPSVQLFLDRAVSREGARQFTADDIVHIAQICRRLDGLPLAIELAAARAEAFDPATLSLLLDDRFDLLTQGRRTALPRHRTLRATIEWSYDLLSDQERAVFRPLGVFPAGFDLTFAQNITGAALQPTDTVSALMAELVAKSLVVRECAQGQVVYRLLDNMRAFAVEKLRVADEADTAYARLAAWLLVVLTDSTPARRLPEPPGLLETVRGVLSWIHARPRDEVLAAALTRAALPMFFERSLMDECARWARLARDGSAQEGAEPGEQAEVLRILGLATMMGNGNLAEGRDALDQARAMADQVGNVSLREAAVDGLYIFNLRIAEYEAAMKLAKLGAARGGFRDADGWKYGLSLQFAGQHAQAITQLRHALSCLVAGSRLDIMRSGIDRRIHARSALCRSLWACGDREQALIEAAETIGEAGALDNPVSLCIALVWTSPILLWAGWRERAGCYFAQLIALGERYALAPYAAIGRGLRGALRAADGEVEQGLQDLRESIDSLVQAQHRMSQPYLLGHLVEALTEAGCLTEGLDVVERAIALVRDETCLTYLPQMLLLKARLVASHDRPGALLIIEAARAEAFAWGAMTYLRQAEQARDALIAGGPFVPVLCGAVVVRALPIGRQGCSSPR